MIHARKDYNGRFQDAAGLIPDNEPVFLIRGQDLVGHMTVRAWAHFHKVNGGSDEVYRIAMAHADRMEAWAVKKLADVPPEGL